MVLNNTVGEPYFLKYREMIYIIKNMTIQFVEARKTVVAKIRIKKVTFKKNYFEDSDYLLEV